MWCKSRGWLTKYPLRADKPQPRRKIRSKCILIMFRICRPLLTFAHSFWSSKSATPIGLATIFRVRTYDVSIFFHSLRKAFNLDHLRPERISVSISRLATSLCVLNVFGSQWINSSESGSREDLFRFWRFVSVETKKNWNLRFSFE